MTIKHVVLIVNKNNNFGLSKDVQLLKESWIAWGRAHGTHGLKVTVADPREQPLMCDVAIHLEVPHPVWFSWGAVQVMMVNGEWWNDSWNTYIDRFDMVIFKTQAGAVNFANSGHHMKENMVIKWKGTVGPSEFTIEKSRARSWTWFLGGSKNKIDAAKRILPLWTNDLAPLKVYSTADLAFEEDGIALAKNITLVKTDLSLAQHHEAASKTLGHIGCSYAESFGFAPAESVAVGAFMMLNPIDTYNEYYRGNSNCHFTTGLDATDEELKLSLAEGNCRLLSVDERELRASQKKIYNDMATQFKDSFGQFADAIDIKVSSAKLVQLPPVVKTDECPYVSIITPVYCYERFLNLALYNLMTTDYPLDKIEWVVIDNTPLQLSKGPVILRMGDKIAPAKLTFVPVDGERRSIAELRNMGVRYAAHDILMFMDLDDYYPPTSFRRRVSWLLKDQTEHDCIVSTAIAGYCLQTARSFMTVPPYNLPLEQRVSEATLCFKRSFWDERGFPEDVKVSEGERFLEGRTKKVGEIPPGQIIVSFLHGSNTSGRYIPEDGASKKPSNVWGFTPAELRFFHGLAGVEIEEMK